MVETGTLKIGQHLSDMRKTSQFSDPVIVRKRETPFLQEVESFEHLAVLDEKLHIVLEEKRVAGMRKG